MARFFIHGGKIIREEKLMTKENTEERAHAKLSASGSGQWLNCPGSVNAQEEYPEEKSSHFAEEGTLAHEIADLSLKNKCNADAYVGKTVKQIKIELDTFKPEHDITQEMCDYVQEYLDYVRSYTTKTTTLYTELRVDFSHVVPEGFGTCDSAVLDPANRVLHIFDLKYGKGVMVDAFENTQGQMYASGFNNEIGFLDEFDHIVIHIAQPRRQSFSSWQISVDELLKFEKYVAERASLALSPDAPRVPGDKQCQWCKAKHDCRALHDFTSAVLMADFDDMADFEDSPENLSDMEIKGFLDAEKLILAKIKASKGYVEHKLYSGESFPGYKLVEGRSISKWNEDAQEKLEKLFGKDQVFQIVEKFVTITEARKKFGPKEIEEYTHKPEGKPTIAVESDSRKPIHTNIAKEFEEFD